MGCWYFAETDVACYGTWLKMATAVAWRLGSSWILLVGITLVSFSTKADLASAAFGPPEPGPPLRPGFTEQNGVPFFNGEKCLLILKRASGATCITAEQINRALYSVLGTSNTDELPRPLENTLDPNYISHIAVVLLRVSRLLAIRYGIPPHMVRSTLPMIETAFTDIYKMCPSFLKPEYRTQCAREARFRTINGLCNNLVNPGWGALHAPYRRETPAVYEDGIECPKGVILCRDKPGCSVYDFDAVPHPYATYLPSPRTVSSAVHFDNQGLDNRWTTLMVAFGQLIDHDITGISITDGVQCCGARRNGHRDCFPIFVDRDPFYAKNQMNCLNFARSRPGLSFGCRLGPREAINAVTSYLDGSFLYGSDASREYSIREHTGGRLKMWDRFSDRKLKSLLPLNTVEGPDSDCVRPTQTHLCFLAGDVRANFQPTLTVVQTVFTRLHNSISDGLQMLNQHWDDERVYQETKKIVGAIFQHVTFNEFLPNLLGWNIVAKYNLGLKKEGYFEGYNPNIDAGIWMSFITAAFRIGHTLITPEVHRYSSNHVYLGKMSLHEQLNQPWELMKPGFIDTYICGMINQPCSRSDAAVVNDVRNHLFQLPGEAFGEDLVARNIQRGRDHGLWGYTAYRSWCGLRPVNTWNDLHGIMANTSIGMLRSIYRNVADIDLFTGGLSEFVLPDALTGETFSCLIALQFKDLREGDRFWYENGRQSGSFTPGQLQQIRMVTMSRILCDQSDGLQEIQKNPFELPDRSRNSRIPCSDVRAFPNLDLRPWLERPKLFVPFLESTVVPS